MCGSALFRLVCGLAAALATFASPLSASPVFAAQNAIKLAAPASLTGRGDYYGNRFLDGVRLATEEANADGGARIELVPEDDKSGEDGARETARHFCATDAPAVVGAALTISALAAGPEYAKCGLVAIATAHGDGVPKSATTFQPVFNSGEMAAALAVYLKYILGGQRAIVLFSDDGYGRPFAEGFIRASSVLDVTATLKGFSNDAEREEAIRFAAADGGRSAIALGVLGSDAVPILVALRRQGLRAPVLGPSALAGEDLVDQFAKEPEEKDRKGFFMDGVYAAAPILFDSANAETLGFADRFRKRYGRDPSWSAEQAYDSARLAIAAARHAGPANTGDAAELATRRKAALDYLASLNSPGAAFPGLTGPIWFGAARHARQPVRVGLFHDGSFDSAPIQLVPVAHPTPEELASGEVITPLPSEPLRRQRVVYTGIFLNEIRRLDLQRSSFSADFYLWMRFAQDAGPNAYDPTDVSFPSSASASFNRASPSEQRALPDGTEYRLWHVDSEFRNEFDLRRFPFDVQNLRLSFFNARADASRVVYVLDRSSLFAGGSQPLSPVVPSDGAHAAAGPSGAPPISVASSDALRELSQWTPLVASERRENLVTTSPLGDRKRAESGARELSGFVVDVSIRRRFLATAAKTLLPLFLMTVIMFASLYFPHGLVKEKVTVAITAALSGAVLFVAVNSQLGNVGYTFAAEYAFYVFFVLSLLCIVSVLLAERLRAANNPSRAAAVETTAKIVYAVGVAVVVAGAAYLFVTEPIA